MNLTISNPAKLNNKSQFTRVSARHSTRPGETSADFSGALNLFGVNAAFNSTPEFLTECNIHGIRNVKFDGMVIQDGITFLHFQAFIEFNVEDMNGKQTARIASAEGRFVVPLAREMKVDIR